MPYITSIERMAIERGHRAGRKEGREKGREEGREEGILAGKIQMLQRILSEPIESEETLLGQSVETLAGKLQDLQQRFDSRKTP